MCCKCALFTYANGSGDDLGDEPDDSFLCRTVITTLTTAKKEESRRALFVEL